MKKLFTLFFILAFHANFYGQEISYGDLNISSISLKNLLRNSGNFFTNEPHELPYFQGKSDNKYIKFYNSTGVLVTMDFKSQSEYLKLINQVQEKAEFRFKFCTDYEEEVVYNYETSNGNKVRFNLNQMRISIDYASSTNNFLDSNFEFSSVFVCVSDDAYAYHTNLRCEGLGNCDSKITKTNIKEAKKYNYKFCEICSDDLNSKKMIKSMLFTTTSKNNQSSNEKPESFSEKLSPVGKTSNPNVLKAEQMFSNYLPTFLESKGGAVIDIKKTYLGDFTSDGIDDVIIWFGYTTGGNVIDGYECAFYEVKNNQVRVVAGFKPDYTFSINNISNGVVYVEKISYGENDPRCCPSVIEPIELIYKNNKIYVME